VLLTSVDDWRTTMTYPQPPEPPVPAYPAPAHEAMHPSLAPESGWYPNGDVERWWSGTEWTGATRPLAPEEVPYPQAPVETHRPPITLRHPIVAGVGIALVVTLAVGGIYAWLQSGGGKPPFVGPAKTSVAGEFVLTDSDTAGAGCIGQGGYTDITPGVSVILTNQDNKILGSSTLGTGVVDSSAGTCTYSFTIPDVPEDQSQYAIEVSHRGKVVNSKSELSANGWKFGLSMGH
jgi:hypothetical protein